MGLLTAVLSPAVNSALFGMPAAAMLPVILLKSVLLAVDASLAAWRAAVSYTHLNLCDAPPRRLLSIDSLWSCDT